MSVNPNPVRTYSARTETTQTFGRVLCSIRDQHLVVDGPVQNGCPGEAPTPGELILAAAAACGTELIQVLAREQGIPLTRIEVEIDGMIDRSNQARENVTTFNTVSLHVKLTGPSEAQAQELVTAYERRCPVYGSLAVASARTEVRHSVVSAGELPSG
jgi:putative redox protein